MMLKIVQAHRAITYLIQPIKALCICAAVCGSKSFLIKRKLAEANSETRLSNFDGFSNCDSISYTIFLTRKYEVLLFKYMVVLRSNLGKLFLQIQCSFQFLVSLSFCLTISNYIIFRLQIGDKHFLISIRFYLC